ncbi:MAG TPA: hypothetical protein GXZ45_09490 [Propionibacterium sp.]|nr:hypothetical protein [Propionibacterium sp.]
MTAPVHPLVAALDAVLEDAARRQGVAVGEVVVIRVEAARWPDSCLGLGVAGEPCTEALTKGYRIRLRGGATYRCDLEGHFRRERRSIPRPEDSPISDEIRLHYTATGGIAGLRHEYETDSTRLTASEVRELRSLITESDFFNAAVGRASEIPDGITRRLWIAVGRRNREVVRGDGVEVKDSRPFDELVSWVEERMVS